MSGKDDPSARAGVPVEERSSPLGWARRTLYGGGGRSGGAWRAASAPLGRLWSAAARRRLERPRDPIRLAAPVVSVGNVTVGGGGKTSLVRWLLEEGTPAGWTVAVLTRGYGRSGDGVQVLAPGGALPGEEPPEPGRLAALAGDEPALLSRAGAWVGVAADRAEGARAVLRHAEPDLFLLDDGLQHRRVARSLDLVTFSAADLSAPARCLPAGPLRQGPAWRPPEGAWIVGGADPREAAWPEGSIGAAFAAWWETLPGTAGRWRDAGTVRLGAWVAGEEEPLPPGGPAVAFAGVARPEGVAGFAADAGFEVLQVDAYPDHHRYTAADAIDLLHRHPETTLLTTEKDAVKLDPGWFGTRPVGVLRRRFDPVDAAILGELLESAAGGPS